MWRLWLTVLVAATATATEYDRFFHGFDEQAEKLLESFSNGLTKKEAQIFVDIFKGHKDDDRLADNEDLWNEHEVVDRLVMLCEEVLAQLNVSQRLNTYFSKSIPATIEMAKNQIINSPAAREKTRQALSHIMSLYDALNPEEKAVVKEVDEMTVLLLEHDGLRSQLKETDEPSTTTEHAHNPKFSHRSAKPNSSSISTSSVFLPIFFVFLAKLFV
ncbi:unnamed protein product [Bursaphelenchus xylophilus]|uniref:(pine wood nematode) hypothetical protein n=1 Tax=Bursaphelenchus xylophilus TaxID=6326 RepID=A0A1I7SUR2_BURXY|nr:unnamed protein product [Bursaphelenchus xylophilus]CAG9125933.1 unnamed protein product [Bursaphelenchus xylophilus]